MKPLVNVYFPAVIALFYLAKVNSEDGNACTCPPIKPAGDLTDRVVLEGAQRTLMQNLWNQTVPHLTKKGERLRVILLRFIVSDVRKWRSTALSSTIWSWSLFSQYDLKPGICAFTEVYSEDGSICACPPIKPDGDLTNCIVVDNLQRSLMEDLWKQPVPSLTKKGEKLRDIQLRLIRSDNLKWKSTALSTTVWAWSLLARYELKPNICAFTKLMNATVTWKLNGDCNGLNSALDGIFDAVATHAGYIATAALLRAECSLDPDSTAAVIQPNCYENCTILLAKSIWKIYGSDYPNEYQQATIDLLSSNDYSDQMLAVIATLSISEPFFIHGDVFRKDIMLQFGTMWLTPKLSDCCCAKFKNEMKLIYPPTLAEALQVNKYIKKEINC